MLRDTCRDSIRYCFGPLITKELTVLVTEWNYHRIRKTANAEAPGGIPEILYCLPDSTGKFHAGGTCYNVYICLCRCPGLQMCS